MPNYWTIVQHSGYGYNHDEMFKKGLEVREIKKTSEVTKVVKVGGLIFNTYTEAADYEDNEPFPAGYNGLIPKAPGTFAKEMIDDLAIYVPATKQKV